MFMGNFFNIVDTNLPNASNSSISNGCVVFFDISSNFLRALSRYVVSNTSFFLFFEIEHFKASVGDAGNDKTFADKSDDS